MKFEKILDGLGEEHAHRSLPSKHLEINTVNNGAELFIVSVKLTATWFSATSPRTTVKNL